MTYKKVYYRYKEFDLFMTALLILEENNGIERFGLLLHPPIEDHPRLTVGWIDICKCAPDGIWEPSDRTWLNIGNAYHDFALKLGCQDFESHIGIPSPLELLAEATTDLD